MLRVGVIGDPVEHSLSPAMQQPALDALGLTAVYELWPTKGADLPGRIASLRGDAFLGANVTVPHKEAVLPFLDELSTTATRAGAVNTIVNRSGRLYGDNTDVYGLARSLSEECADLAQRDVLILGAGGAARGTVLALESAGVERIAIANRTRDRAERLAAALAPVRLELVDLGSAAMLERLETTGVLINATASGWQGDERPVDDSALRLLPRDAVVMDLTYRETALLAAAKKLGLSTLDGLAMLVYQGARSLELWTGRSAPIDLMMAAAVAARINRA